MKNEKFKLSSPIPIRFDESVLAEIEKVSSIMKLSKQEIVRLTVAIGLVCLEKTGYDLPRQIAEKALSK